MDVSVVSDAALASRHFNILVENGCRGGFRNHLFASGSALGGPLGNTAAPLLHTKLYISLFQLSLVIFLLFGHLLFLE